jgi:alkylation response protein AidB-like acyl-CoA dehydrogenase
MEFPLDPSETELRDSLRAFALRSGPLLSFPRSAGEGLPAGVREALFSRRLLGMDQGDDPGTGLRPGLVRALSLMEVARASPLLAAVLAVHNFLCSRYVRLFGSPLLRSEFLSRRGAGRGLGTRGEARGPAGLRAAPSAGGWVLDGRQALLTPPALCDWMIVTASPGGPDPGSSAFVVDGRYPGLSWTRVYAGQGGEESRPGEAVFDRVIIPAARLLGTPGRAETESRQAAAGADGALAGLCSGLAESALARCLEAGRPTPGRLSVRSRKAARLAERLIEMETVRFMTCRASLRDGGGEGAAREAREAADSAYRLALTAASEARELLAPGAAGVPYLPDLEAAIAAVTGWNDLRAAHTGPGGESKRPIRRRQGERPS